MVPGSAVQALAAGQTMVDTFTYTVTDNASVNPQSVTQTVTINATGRNDNAVAVNDTYAITENQILTTTDVDLAPRNHIGDATPGNTNDDSVFVNDNDTDTNDVLKIVSFSATSAQGVPITMNIYINAARYARKTHTSNVQTFTSGEVGARGYVDEDKVMYYYTVRRQQP
jgi:hypothetical protein